MKENLILLNFVQEITNNAGRFGGSVNYDNSRNQLIVGAISSGHVFIYDFSNTLNQFNNNPIQDNLNSEFETLYSPILNSVESLFHMLVHHSLKNILYYENIARIQQLIQLKNGNGVCLLRRHSAFRPNFVEN